MKRLTIISLSALLTASAAPAAFGWGYHGGGGGSYSGRFGGSFSHSDGSWRRERSPRRVRVRRRRILERERLSRRLRLGGRGFVVRNRMARRQCLGWGRVLVGARRLWRLGVWRLWRISRCLLRRQLRRLSWRLLWRDCRHDPSLYGIWRRCCRCGSRRCGHVCGLCGSEHQLLSGALLPAIRVVATCSARLAPMLSKKECRGASKGR
jgi:hypothetical protein